MSEITKELLYTGKAKDVYKTENENEVIIKFRDDITALDGGRKDTLSKKGEYNALISAKLFQILEERGIKTQFIRLVEPNEMLTKSLDMIPLEVICRNIATGSLLRKYPFHRNQELNPPIIQFDYKNDVKEKGLILVDFKIEFGLDTEGNIVLGDEISPDTTRLWDSETLDNFDKDIFRKGEEGVVDAYHKVVDLVLTTEEKEKWNVEKFED